MDVNLITDHINNCENCNNTEFRLMPNSLRTNFAGSFNKYLHYFSFIVVPHIVWYGWASPLSSSTHHAILRWFQTESKVNFRCVIHTNLTIYFTNSKCAAGIFVNLLASLQSRYLFHTFMKYIPEPPGFPWFFRSSEKPLHSNLRYHWWIYT